ncbi:MAG TPA: transcription elongation factor Spt5 [Candidatus Nanoarchaeia archaeon]|nr:transcription elongation factor Spt5 [Candidatus Nanoarchaeia archaeon]
MGDEQKEVQGVPVMQGEQKPEVPAIAGAQEVVEEVKAVEVKEAPKKEKFPTHIFAVRTTANREDQVMDFLVSNIKKKKLPVFSVIRPHGMRGYIFVEAADKQSAEQAAFNVPYARGILAKEIDYSEIEHMLEQVKREVDIRKNDVVEIIAGPFKREQAKVTRIDKTKEEVVVELLGAAVPIPITVKMDAVKVIRRESAGASETEQSEEEI